MLDGSRGGNGVTTGDNLEFIDAGTTANSSGPGGFSVEVNQAATRSIHSGSIGLSQGIIDSGEQITISEGGKTVNFLTEKGKTVEQTLNDLSSAIKDSGMDLDLIRAYPPKTDGNLPQAITFRHKEFGSEHTFQVASNTAGLVSNVSNMSVAVENGLDVVGVINGVETSGQGQVLTGAVGAESTEGIRIRYTGESIPPGSTAGTLTFAQNSLTFQVGGNANQFSEISLKSIKTTDLGRGQVNASDFKSLSDVNMLSSEGAQDAIKIIDKAIEEISVQRGDMGAFQKNNLESNLNYLRIAHENTVSSESVIRDADMAAEMGQFTRDQIMMEASTAMLAQANQSSMNVLKLLG